MRNNPLESIKTTADFKKVYKLGKVASNGFFAVYAYPNGKNSARLGLSIGKKVGKAIVRNKLRRWIKEYFRLNKHMLPGADIVVVAKSKAKELVIAGKFALVELNMLNLLKRLAWVEL